MNIKSVPYIFFKTLHLLVPPNCIQITPARIYGSCLFYSIFLRSQASFFVNPWLTMTVWWISRVFPINTLNPELNPICCLLALLGANHFLHVSRIKVKSLTFRLLMSYTRVGTLIVATIYLQLIQNRYMFRSFTVLRCSHQHCVQRVASDVEVVGHLQQRLLCW